MHIHLKNSLISFIKFLAFVGLICAAAFLPIKLGWLTADDLISSFLIGIIVLVGGSVMIWLVFKMTSEIYKSILHRSYRVEDAFLLDGLLHLITYGVRSGSDDGPYTEYYYYLINPETGAIQIKKSSEKDIRPDLKSNSKPIKPKTKKVNGEKIFTIAYNDITIKLTPFSVFFGFDEGIQISAILDDKPIWSKKL
jgi:hypothetical protein